MGLILTSLALPSLRWCHFAPARSEAPEGPRVADDIGLLRWFVQGGDLGGHFQAFIQHINLRSAGISAHSSPLPQPRVLQHP